VHPAPALILALGFAAYAVASGVLRPETQRARLIELAIIAGVALAFIIPFVGPLFRAYHFKTLNADPSRHVGLALKEIVRDLATPRTLLAGFGVWTAWQARSTGKPSSRTILMLSVAGSALLLFGYGLAAQILESRHLILPVVTPAFHFHIYVNAFELMAFGVGFAALMRRLAGWAQGHGLAPASSGRVTGVLLLALTLLVLPRHLRGKDLSSYRQDALTFSSDPRIHDLYDWLRRHTPPNTVVLCDDALCVYTVAPAGRGVVSLPENYSNPYVAREPRAADRDRMFEAVRNRDVSLFASLVAQYRVGYVAFRGAAIPSDAALFNLKRVGHFGDVELDAVVTPDPAGATPGGRG
jgi:hypothetical protein